MNRFTKEWLGLSAFIALVGILSIYAKSLNDESFWEESRIMFAVKSEVANLRAGPSTDDEIILQIKERDIVELRFLPQDWNRVIHIATLKEGWIHRSTLSRYLSLGYYDEKIIGKSVLELTWPNLK